eukprot:scaffold379767_cov59-Attheya_sp.AAC.1
MGICFVFVFFFFFFSLGVTCFFVVVVPLGIVIVSPDGAAFVIDFSPVDALLALERVTGDAGCSVVVVEAVNGAKGEAGGTLSSPSVVRPLVASTLSASTAIGIARSLSSSESSSSSTNRLKAL